MSTALATGLHQSPSFDGRFSAESLGFVAPSFLEARRLCKKALTDMGERCSTRRAHRLAEVLVSIWKGDSVPLGYSDPTGEQAVKNVMREVLA